VKHLLAIFLCVRSTYREPLTRTTPSVLRVALSWFSLLAGVSVLVALSGQITEQVLVGSFRPERYFSYFTIQTSLINIAVLLLTGLHGLRSARDYRHWTAIRAHIVSYAVITGVVYNLLLRNIPAEPGMPVLQQWPNDITHVWIPLYLVLDWLVNPERSYLSWKALSAGIIFPVFWLGFALVRGQLTGWYPYSFINPAGELGVPGQLAHVGVMGLIIILTLVATGLINRIHHSLSPSAR